MSRDCDCLMRLKAYLDFWNSKDWDHNLEKYGVSFEIFCNTSKFLSTKGLDEFSDNTKFYKTKKLGYVKKV